MPSLPSWSHAWLLARESGDAAIALATITHPEWGAPIRLARNTADVLSRGITFQKAYFEIDLVTDDDNPPKAQFSVPNVDREIGLKFLNLTAPPEVAIEIVSSAYLDEPIYRAARLEIRNVLITSIQISGELASRDYSTEPLGTIVMTPSRAPALFRLRR